MRPGLPPMPTFDIPAGAAGPTPADLDAMTSKIDDLMTNINSMVEAFKENVNGDKKLSVQLNLDRRAFAGEVQEALGRIT